MRIGTGQDIAALALHRPELEEFPGAELSNQGYWILLSDRTEHLQSLLEADSCNSSDTLLLFVAIALARAAASSLEALAVERERSRLPAPCIVLVYESNTLMKIPRPELAGCRVLAIVEGPVRARDVTSAAIAARSSASA